MKRQPLQRWVNQAFPVAAVTLAVAAVVTACGGGGGGASGGITLSGIAATGAAMSGATVVVKDSTDVEVQTCNPCTVGSDGSFSIPLSAAAKGPFVLIATQDGVEEPEVSMIDTAVSANINITPITTMIAARLAPSGDPTRLTATDSTLEKIESATEDVKTVLQPLLEAAGVPNDANPLTMGFAANSTGLDKALDMMGKPTIVRDPTSGNATVEIEIKTSGSDTAGDTDNAPAKISMAAGSLPVATANITLNNMRAIMPLDFSGVKIQALIQRMQDCYALAPTERRTDGAKLPTEITASVCKEIFVDNAPDKYLHNNYVVSAADATLTGDSGGRFTGAFKGIFGNVQGLKFDLPEYRYTVINGNTSDPTNPMNGDVVFTARWTVKDPNAGASLGQSDVSEYHARPGADGQLKMIGNQSKHDLNVNAQARREEMPGAPDFAYMATGYNIGIQERKWNHDNNSTTARVSIYEQVVVTSPSGKTFNFKPHPSNNLDYLGLVNNNNIITKSATVRLNGMYNNGASTGLHPSERFTNEFWGSKDEWTDTAIQAIPAQGNWRFDITLTQAFKDANPNTVPSRTFSQYRRTINRAPTLTELQAMKWPAAKDPVISTLVAAASTDGLGYVPLGANNTAQNLAIDGWDVPNGAWSPTHVKVYNTAWDEGADVASTARKVDISCKGPGAHCHKIATANTGKFINTGFGYLQLTGRDSKRLQMSLNYSTRKTSSDN